MASGVAELRRHKVDLRLNTFAEREDVLAEEPELMIVATGGLPRNPLTGPGAELTRDTWDMMGGGVRLSGDVLVYDNHGGTPLWMPPSRRRGQVRESN